MPEFSLHSTWLKQGSKFISWRRLPASEDEWRKIGDVDLDAFSAADLACIVRSKQEAKEVENMSGLKTYSLYRE